MNEQAEKSKNLKHIIFLCALTFISCAVMGALEAFVKPQYIVKSIIKLCLFLPIPAAFAFLYPELDILSALKPKKKSFLLSLLMGVGIFTVIVGAYFLLRNLFDLEGITSALTENLHVDKSNFLYVALYISFVNSLLEELFFRGFIFLTLKKLSGRIFAYAFSSVLFALYHCTMMLGWGSVWLYLLCLLGVFIGGVIFNFLDEKSESIFPSWFAHMFANFAINFIGFMLFGIV